MKLPHKRIRNPISPYSVNIHGRLIFSSRYEMPIAAFRLKLRLIHMRAKKHGDL